MGARVEPGEGAAPLAGEGENGAAAVDGGLAALHERALFEGAEHAAQVSGVEAERLHDGGGRRTLLVGELIQHANLGQRELALQEPFVQDADFAGVEAVEVSNRGDAGVEGGIGHEGENSELIDFVN